MHFIDPSIPSITAGFGQLGDATLLFVMKATSELRRSSLA